ncbi:hypothetical protein DKB58_01780 [Capnocytophaga canimorsus]|uniref:hypothetical protein n=1 Tax=Capnocytophaga canimorsus TaxID=28188 RepID=UPI000D6DCF3E|nr:hypothetical protein [Capnocytophaga canimorsus]AWL77778.1 hypothetical protein DKB58_01780 [Capnocytophaga canimorsus]
MKGKNNDFSMSFYHNGQLRLFLKYVHNTNRAVQWVNAKGIPWDYYIIYERRTERKLETVTNNYAIPRYSITFVNNGIRSLHLSAVYDVHQAVEWAMNKGVLFDYYNVYDYTTREFIERVYV